MRALAFLLALVIAASAQSAPPAPPMVIEPSDADAFREIIAVTPPPYNALFVRWYMAILQRQQEKAKAAADAKGREDAEKK